MEAHGPPVHNLTACLFSGTKLGVSAPDKLGTMLDASDDDEDEDDVGIEFRILFPPIVWRLCSDEEEGDNPDFGV